MKRPGVRSVLFSMLLLGALLAINGSALPASAASTITLSTCDDDSLYGAINSAAAGDTIVFDCSGTISVAGTGTFAYTILKDLTIDGTGQNVVIDGGGSSSMFNVGNNATLTLDGFTFTGGSGATTSDCYPDCYQVNSGGVITVIQGTVNIRNSTFTNNFSSGVVGGGAILSTLGTVSVDNSTFSGNTAYGDGGVIQSLSSTLTVTNSTFSGNLTRGSGAGINVEAGTAMIRNSTFVNNTGSDYAGKGYGGGVASTGTTTITNSTFSGNQASAGGAIITKNGTVNVVDSTIVGNHASLWGNGVLTGIVNSVFLAVGGTTNITNTILANGPTQGDFDGFPKGGNCVTSGTLNDGGGNYSDDETCPGNHVSKDDLHLGTLANNGGPTQTIAITTDSVAKDAVSCISTVNIDQRGYTRSTTGSTCDAGAYEFGAINPIKATTLSAVSGVGIYGGTATLTTTLKTSGSAVSGKLITFKLNGTGVGSATTNSSGVASLTGVSLSGISGGSHANAVGVSFAGDSSYSSSTGSGSLSVNRADQTISFDLSTLPAESLGDPPFDISNSASATSGLAVSFSSTTSDVCTVSGSTVTMIGLGFCTIQADQIGDGNYNAAPSVQQSFVVIDTTPPVTTASAATGSSSAYTFGDWTNQTVTITLSAIDTGSGVASTTYQIDGQSAQNYSAPFDISAEGSHIITFFSVDLTNNIEPTQSVAVKIDLTAPTISGAPTSSPNGFGWYNHPVVVHWTCDDQLSGVASCPIDQTIATEGTNQSVSGIVTDQAGNQATTTSSPAVNIDLTAPTNVLATPDRAPNGAGWYNAPVNFTFSGEDAISGIDNCTSVTYSGPDNATASVSGGCTDVAGNTTAVSTTIAYDATAPVVTLTSDKSSYTILQTVTITCAVSDALSGVVSPTCATITAPAYTFDIGSNSVSSTAMDIAGNVGTGTVTFTVTGTANDLTTLTNQFVANPTIARQFSAPLGGIALAERMHNARMKQAFLNSYVLLVNQQRGRALTNQEADTLIRLASTL